MLYVTPTKPDTQIQSLIEGETLILIIRSESGIGGVEVSLPSPRPKRVVLRLYLQGLEQLRFEYAAAMVQASVSSGPGQLIQQSVRPVSNALSEGQAIRPDTPYWMPLRLVAEGGESATIPLKVGYIEVTAPPHFMAGNFDRFSLQWVDFFR